MDTLTAVSLTDNAQKAVRGFISGDESLAGKALRFFVKGGGCSGFQYGFTFSDEQEGDERVQFEGFEVLIDPSSMPYVKGCVVDFVDGLQGQGFSVTNPNSSGSCGCGQSFST